MNKVDEKAEEMIACISSIRLQGVSQNPHSLGLLDDIQTALHDIQGSSHLSPLPLFFLSIPLKPAIPTSTLMPAFSSWPPPAGPLRPSAGPLTVQITFVLPISRYELPSAAACVEIWAWIRRSSFHRRPSRRRWERAYIEVSRGISHCLVCTMRCATGRNE